MDFFTRLYQANRDACHLVLERCDYRDLVGLERTCRNIRQILNQVSIWQHLWRSSLSPNLPVGTDELPLKRFYLQEMQKITALSTSEKINYVIQHDYMQFLRGFDFKALSPDGQSLVIDQAARWNRCDLVKSLVLLCRPDQYTLDGLMFMASLSHQLDLMKFYIRNRTNRPGYTSIHYGIYSGDRELIEMLVTPDLPLDQKDQLYCATNGNVATMKILRDLGHTPPPTILETIFRSAAESDRVDAIEYLLQMYDCKALCQECLHECIRTKCVKVVTLFCNQGYIDVDKLSDYKFQTKQRKRISALEYAAINGWPEMFQVLSPYFPSFSPADHKGHLLFSYFERRRFDMLALLLRYPIPSGLMDGFVTKAKRHQIWDEIKPLLPQELQSHYTHAHVEELSVKRDSMTNHCDVRN